MVEVGRRFFLKDILNKNQIYSILRQSIGENVSWNLEASEIKPAMDGLAGFLGDHMKAVLHVDVKGEKKKVHLFIKRVPVSNKPKAEFINAKNFFRREMLMFQVFDEICRDSPKPWCLKVYIYTDTLFVMPDLTIEGYATKNFLHTLDLEHVFVATASVAQFHAAFANYETKKSTDLKRLYTITQEFGQLLKEASFFDSPWLRACSKLSTNLLKTFCAKTYRNMPDLESKLNKKYIEACDTLMEYEDTINVLLHKDLWVNNIMFKYENDVPVNAVLIDYQCIGYGPPAFDLMMLLYLTTDRSFREERERDVFDHYYSVFIKNLNDHSQKRLEHLGYNKENFLKWCVRGRMFGMLVAIAVCPFALMDPKTAQETFDDPKTYEKYINEDRSEPVLAHADRCVVYKRRNLALVEEFVETYVLEQQYY